MTSFQEGGDAAMPGEVDLTGAVWVRSIRSGSDGGNCVEVARVRQHVAVRDSKDIYGPVLILPADVFASFLDAVKAGEFDR